MDCILTQVTPPASEPVSLTEAKSHLRVTGSDEDTFITALIGVARQYVEQYLSRSLVQQTWRLEMPQWPKCYIKALRPPLHTVSSVQYLDADNALQTLATDQYVVTGALSEGYGCIGRAEGVTWPTHKKQTNAVQLNYIAGYADDGGDPIDLTANIPQPIKHAILLLIGHYYENREDSAPIQIHSVPRAVDALLYPYRAFFV